MYQYDELDRAVVDARVEEFRDQVQRRLRGELTEDEFRPLRLMNGLYLQLHAYMLRVAIPYGTLSSEQMRRLAHIARTYDRGYGHFTTRQNIQFNWPKLVDVPDILHELADVEMHAIQTSGNCIRNVTTDPFAGAAGDEVDDPRPTCELIRQWSSMHPELTFLPRKFKIAVTASEHDRAAIRFHDIGIRIYDHETQGRGFEIFVGGGLGRTPRIAERIRAFVPPGELLRYLTAILRVYNEQGRRDNKFKARIKILVGEMGMDAFRDAVDRTYEALPPLEYEREELDRVREHFPSPVLEPAPVPDSVDVGDPLWLQRNVVPHRHRGYVNVVISLKPHGGIPGDITAAQMDAVAHLADRFAFSEIRTTHQQNLVFAHVRRSDLAELWRALDRNGLAASNAGLLTDMITCPGLDYCNLASARSIPIAQKIALRFDGDERLVNIGDVALKISGCVNACGHHHIGGIGILGVDRRGDEAYQLLLGGSADERPALATTTGRGFSEEGIVDAIETVVDVYLAQRSEGESFGQLIERLGLAPFKEALYGDA